MAQSRALPEGRIHTPGSVRVYEMSSGRRRREGGQIRILCQAPERKRHTKVALNTTT